MFLPVLNLFFRVNGNITIDSTHENYKSKSATPQNLVGCYFSPWIMAFFCNKIQQQKLMGIGEKTMNLIELIYHVQAHAELDGTLRR